MRNHVPVEIKAQSFENRNNFISDAEEDLEKLDEERSADFAGSSCIMMDIALILPPLNQLKNIRRDEHPVFAEIFSGEIAICLAVWSKADGWWKP